MLENGIIKVWRVFFKAKKYGLWYLNGDRGREVHAQMAINCSNVVCHEIDLINPEMAFRENNLLFIVKRKIFFNEKWLKQKKFSLHFVMESTEQWQRG